ncbi:DNA ligase 1 [Juglans microcarpa x Juglans regia]|uniref:DNA ligase 1 n=1 Tax=Juglans microcarpa x Juglans regia TaxID=2249226 RepID=UPI001B7EA30F|nr:DNA ligase 1 [Juglans microcarpa x Juglans regia]
MEQKGGDEEMDSLFEGMVLFNPSQLAADQREEEEKDDEEEEDHHDDHGPPVSIDVRSTASTSSSSHTYSYSSSQPLDENLFSDLTIVTPPETQSQSQPPSSANDTDPTPISMETSTTPVTPTISRQISRKKKRASLRIGYGRDAPSPSLPDAVSDQIHTSNRSDANALVSEDGKTIEHDDQILQGQQEQEEQQEEEDEEEEAVVVDKEKENPSPELDFEHIKAQISEKLNRARELVASISAARKDSIRRRRKAAENVNLASIKHRELEKDLEEACEAEDFEKAERVSESLAAAEKEKQAFLIALRDAEAEADAIDSEMHAALEAQIAAEEQGISVLDRFAKDAANNADLVLQTAHSSSSEETDKWFSSTEALEVKKMELEIESHLIDETRQVLTNSIEHSIEDDKREKELLFRKKDILTNELEKLLELVKQKEKEIAENDSNIQAVEKKIADVFSGFQEMQSNVDTKYDKLRSSLSQMILEIEALSVKKKEIDEFFTQEEEKSAKLREFVRVSTEEANAYREVVELRKILMESILKAQEDKLRLVKTEEKLSEDVQVLQKDISDARASLQELSSRKSNIQQDIESFKQRILFIEKRVPELEAEKKVAAAARNFKEAARIAAEAKSSSVEKEGIQIDMESAVLGLKKLEEEITYTVNRLRETESLILSKEKEVAMARFHRLLLIAGAATAERAAALELGDLEEANLLLAEAETADSEAKKLQPIYNFKVEEFENLPSHFISMELVSKLGRKQLAELAAAVSPSVQ